MLLYQDRIIIPQTERIDVLKSIHEGHLGIYKCTERAKKAVWWPSLTKAIVEMVGHCTQCKQHAPEFKEPLRPIETPARPWQVVASDLFYHDGSCYLLVVDLYSRYPEIARMRKETTEETVLHLREIFARHGIPEVLMSDNGPQYASDEFKRFSERYEFRCVTSSPRYPRANGTAERMVQTVKNIFKKSIDPHLGLLAYRTAPLITGFSPAQLLMNRELRTTIPQLQRTVETAQHTTHYAKNEEYKHKMKDNHDKAHRVRQLPPLNLGDQVHIRDMNRAGVIVQQEIPGTRKYQVESNGKTVTRNRTALIHKPETSGSAICCPASSPVNTALRSTDTPLRKSNRQTHKPRRLIEKC